MKKQLSLVLALALAGTLAACSGGNTPQPETTPSTSVEAASANSVQTNAYVGKSFSGQGMSAEAASGSSFNIVDVTLTVEDGEQCKVTYPIMSFEPTFTVRYTLEGSSITLGECLAAEPVDSLKEAWAGVTRKTFILNEDGTMISDPAPEQIGSAEEQTEAPSESTTQEEADNGAETEADSGASEIPENAMYFDYAFSLHGQEIADSFCAEAADWYAALGTDKYEPTQSEEELFAFQGSWCVITCYQNGTYVLSSSVNAFIKDTGTWTWENYQFTLTRDADAENLIVASINR